ncbi:unnamed protein product [Cochlearia groenlandica]
MNCIVWTFQSHVVSPNVSSHLTSNTTSSPAKGRTWRVNRKGVVPIFSITSSYRWLHRKGKPLATRKVNGTVCGTSKPRRCAALALMKFWVDPLSTRHGDRAGQSWCADEV